MKTSLRLLPLAVFLGACGGALNSEDVGPAEDTPASRGSGGVSSTPSAAPVPPTSGFALLGPSPAHMAALLGAPDTSAQTPDGHSLGYVPAPVDIAQDPPQYVTVANYPARYDLRAFGKLPAIRDQGSCGSCWTFATFASSESTLLPGDKEDFSEDHLNNTHGFDVPACNGGNHLMSIAYLSRWSGPASESDAPYTGKVHAFSKSPAAVKHLTEAYILPARSGPLDNDVIKSAVSTYGAMYTTINWQSANYSGSSFAYFHPGPSTSSNHAVAIVGWDDDFPASRFAKAPAGDGAFIIRNSWGAGFGDGGYFYVSYYDAFVGRDNVVFQSFDPISDYAGVYQVDKLGQTSALTYPSGTAYSANIFSATTETGLLAVSFYTTAPATTVTIKVYDAPSSSPSTGTLVGTTEVAEAFAGYHTVGMSQLGIKLHAGRKFSVIVRVANGGAKSYVPVEAPFPGYSSKVVAAAGAGFVSGDGAAWMDTAKTFKANVPVKAFFGALPSCDDKNACTTDAWDGTQCTHTAAAQGFVCRPKAGDCDVAEVCDGTGAACPADELIAADITCRPSAGDCDQAEVCTGKSAACPTNKFLSSVVVCRAAAGVCDSVERCTGTSAACPRDVLRPAGIVCNASPRRVCSGRLATCL
jgi:C1A family cysteine protease